MNSLLSKPKEWADAVLFFELHLQAAAGHDTWLAQPAGVMIKIDAVHVEAGTYLFDLPFVARQLIDERHQKIHTALFMV
jgi:hypothetical protein